MNDHSERLARAAAGQAERFREVLELAGYDERQIVERLGAIEMPTRRARNLPRLLYRTSELTRLDVLIRLFLIGVPVEAGRAREALAPEPLEAWAECGLVKEDAGQVSALVKIVPFQGIMLAFDFPEEIETGARADIVPGMTGSSLALVHFAIRRPVAATLDLGAGSGIQSLAAARHSDRVWAVDNNPRATNFARFNARLNKAANIEFRTGDMFAPVGGMTFDLVLCNPPFMISPQRRYLYRDGGLEGDGFSRQVLRQVPAYLNEGGFCQLVCDWIEPEGQDWKERLADWVRDAGCDTWVFHTETQDLVTYADQWVRDTEQDDAALKARLFEEYVAYYKHLKISAIQSLGIAMRRRSAAANWIRFEQAPSQKPAPFGDAVALEFELYDYLETVRRDEALLEARLRLSPALRLEHQCAWVDGAWRTLQSRLHLVTGIHYVGAINAAMAALLERLDGTRPVREVLSAAASAHGLEVAAIAPDCLAVLRRLIERGFVLPGVRG